MIALSLFLLSSSVLLYAYIGYPVALAIASRWTSGRGRGTATGLMDTEASLPSLSVLVIARNEGERIEAKMENLLRLVYPRDRLQLVVASDGSTDSTVERVRHYADRGIELMAFPSPRGKPAVLNDVVPGLTGEIVVLMDTRQRVTEDALLHLAARFADPVTGAVSGELEFEQADQTSGTGGGMGVYWRLEKYIRRQEAWLDSSVGVTGALYAIRRTLYRAIPEDTLLDDVLIPMLISRQGYRVLFASEARAIDQLPQSADSEYRRKVRTLAGNFQLLRDHPWLIHPWRNRLWRQTVSHKFLRLAGPACLLTILLTTLWMASAPMFQSLLAAQALFYGAAWAGHRGWRPVHAAWLTSVPFTFCLLNWSIVAGFIRFARGRQPVTWQRAH